MQIPMQITFKNVDPSPAVEANIREKAGKLERFHDRITSLRVVVEAPHKHQRKGRLFNVSLDITLPPRKEIVVNRAGPKNHAHEDVYVAIRDAFAAAVRQVEDAVRVLRDDVKTHETPGHGRILRLFEDHGFIETADGQEIYFHRNSVINGEFAKLAAGDEVRVVAAEEESPHGPQATTVQPIGKHHIVP